MATNKLRLVAGLLIVSLSALPAARADMLGTERSTYGALDREDIAARLVAFGVNPTDAKARVAVLAEHEISQLAVQTEAAPAGGAGTLGVILVGTLVMMALTAFLGLLEKLAKAGSGS